MISLIVGCPKVSLIFTMLWYGTYIEGKGLQAFSIEVVKLQRHF